MKNSLQDPTSRKLIAILFLCLMAFPVHAVTVISSGHVEIFEVEYEQDGTNRPTLHLGVHTDTTHHEPGDVLLEVKADAFTSTALLPSNLTNLLGANAWILPADLQEAANLGVLEAGVGKAGFPDTTAVTFTLIGAGPNNPGNFALFTASNAIRLSSTGDTVGSNLFSITTGHIHYNWGFSAPGTYSFDLKASYTDAAFGLLESAVETYTFNVIPEPSSGALLVAGIAALVSARRRIPRA